MDPNVGTSLVSGIQDISALLPIIGTEQCERHVGEALKGGFLYAAATPLSLFGSLGIVKAGAAVFVASFSPRSAQMLADSGFKLEGAIAGMIAKAPMEKIRGEGETDPKPAQTQYMAGQRFLRLLQEQHIRQTPEDKTNVQFELNFNCLWWNVALCLSTLILSGLSIGPYICIILQDRETRPPAWVYPLIRIAGSAISVVLVQMIIQIRMRQILGTQQLEPPPAAVENTLLRFKNFMKAIWESKPEQNEEMEYQTQPPAAAPQNNGPPPSRLKQITRRIWKRELKQDQEKGHGTQQPASNLPPSPKETTRALSWTYSYPMLWLLQALLLVGLAATGVGYLGCFTVVQRATPTNTYIWLGVEVALSLLRIIIWGVNPSWDENNPILAFEFRVIPPTITTGQDFQEFITGPEDERESFVVLTATDFLDYIAPYTGPLEQFSDPEHHLAVYYTLAGCIEPERKILLTTILDLETRNAYVLVHDCLTPQPDGVIPPPSLKKTIFSADFKIIHSQDLAIMTTSCNNMLGVGHEFMEKGRFSAVDTHSQTIATRIGGANRVKALKLSWALDVVNDINDSIVHGATMLAELDRNYLRSQVVVRKWRKDFYSGREAQILELNDCVSDLRKEPFFDNAILQMEALLLSECVIFEETLVKKLQPDDLLNHPFYEHTRRLEVLTAHETREGASRTRVSGYEAMLGKRHAIVNMIRWLMATRDFDGEVGNKLKDSDPSRFYLLPLQKTWQREVQRKKMSLDLWKTDTSFHPDIVKAIFDTYPESSNDATLVNIMLKRGNPSGVFDLSATQAAANPDVLPYLCSTQNTQGISILGCPPEWLARIHTNTHIMGVDVAGMSRQELQQSVQEKWAMWTRNTRIELPEERAISWFYLPPGTRSNGAALTISSSENGILIVKAGYGGTLHVNLWHRPPANGVMIDWELQDTEQMSDFLTHSENRTFKRDSFTVDLPKPGVFRIDIMFAGGHGVLDELRRVWVVLDPREQSSSDSDEDEDHDTEEVNAEV